ncbi:hypothetical protein E4U61_000480 [Claviceps capensis]|nr:hypothetical protein E4U61_000480 [Claviceps capensis]
MAYGYSLFISLQDPAAKAGPAGGIDSNAGTLSVFAKTLSDLLRFASSSFIVRVYPDYEVHQTAARCLVPT